MVGGQSRKLAILSTIHQFQNLLEFNRNRRMPSSGMLHHVVLVRNDVSEEHTAFIIRVTKS
jgi:hypothetical protein